ncbi:MAG: HesA/MoeB/ThiF family protein [Planctomycetaceae bacterium]
MFRILTCAFCNISLKGASVEHRCNADFSRNLGLLSKNQQRAVCNARIVVCGVGGMGGVAAEGLTRLGVGTVLIADPDVYESHDVNRQLHCTLSNVGKRKIDVVAAKLRDINPLLELTTVPGVDESNAESVVAFGDIIINGMDCVRSSILLEREARRQRKTIVDAWLTPYASVFVMTPDAPHWEDFLEFPTKDKAFKDISDADVQECFRLEVGFTFSQFTPYEIVSEQLVEGVLRGTHQRPSLMPVVWLSGTLMANEAMKLITGQGAVASHWGVFYNQYDHELRKLSGSQ